jgi:hypothetical protein
MDEASLGSPIDGERNIKDTTPCGPWGLIGKVLILRVVDCGSFAALRR